MARSTTALKLSTDDMEDERVMALLVTEATNLNLDDVSSTIMLVKPGETEKETIKRIKKALVKPLTRTYAFLMNLKEDDDEVTKFTQSGLAEMIFYRLKQLMPKGCKTCNIPYVNGRTEVPLISCKLCGTGACKDCFPPEERSSKWSFLCVTCDKQIENMMGEAVLDKSHFRVRKKQDKADGANKEKEDENEEEVEGTNVEEKENEEEEVIEVVEDDFKVPKKRGFRSKKDKEEEKDEHERKTAICYHFKKARCHHGLSGKQPHNGVPKCPFRHPMICQKLLRHGDRAKGGCRGKVDGCNDFHGVKMCYSSMNTKKCDHLKNCPNGYHVKGTVFTGQKEERKSEKNLSKVPLKKEPERMRKAQEPKTLSPGENNSNVSSFLDQIFQQQQNMIAEQEKQRKDQMLLQQQMMQMMARLGGALEGRMSPMMGMQNSLGNQTFNLRPIGQ